MSFYFHAVCHSSIHLSYCLEGILKTTYSTKYTAKRGTEIFIRINELIFRNSKN